MKPQIFVISLLGLSFVSAQNLFDTGYGVQIPYSGNGASSAYNSYGYNKYNNNQEPAESGSGDPLRRALGLWGRLLNKMAQPSPPTDDELRLRALNANQQVDDGLEYEQPYQQPYQQPSLGQLGAGIAAKAIKNIQSAGLLNGLYKQENNQEIPNSLLNRLDGPGSLIDPKRLEQILPRTIDDVKKTESTTTTTTEATTTTTTESTTSTSTTTTEASTTEEPTTTTKPERTTKKATKKTTTTTAATTTTTEEPKETEKPRKKSTKRAKSVEKTTRQPKSEEYMEDEEEEMLKKSRFSLRTTVRTEDEVKTTKKVKITTTVKPTTSKPKVKSTEVTTKKVIASASTTTSKPHKESKKEHKGLEKIREEEEYDDEEYSEGSGEEYEEITTTTTVKPKHSKNRSKEKRKSSEKKAKPSEEKRKKEEKKAKSDEEKRKIEEKESDSDVTVLKFIDENIPEAEEEQNQFQRDEVPQTTTLAPIEIPTFTLNPKAFEMSDSKLNNVISQAGTIIDGVGPLILPLLGFSRTAAGAAFAQPTFGAAAAAAAPARVAGVRSYKPSAKSEALQPLPSVEAPAEVEQTGFQHTQPSEPSRPIPYRRKAEKMYPKSSTPPPVKLPTADELRQRQEFENSIIDGERQRLLKQKAELEKRTQQIEEQRQLQLQLQEEHRRLQIQKQIELMKLEEERKRLQEDQVLPVGNKPSLDRLVASDTATGPIPRYLGDNAPEVNEAALLEAYRTIFEHNRQKIINPDVVVPPAEVQEKISEIRRQPTPDDPGYKLGRNQVSNMFYEDSGLMVGTQPSDSGVIALTNAVGGGGFGNGRRPDTVPFA